MRPRVSKSANDAVIASRMDFSQFRFAPCDFYCIALYVLYVRISSAVRALERRCALYLRILKIYLTKWTYFNFRAVRSGRRD